MDATTSTLDSSAQPAFAASAQSATNVQAIFTGEPRRFLRLAFIGCLLQIPTVGFYRFWLITDVRRHLWSHTQIGGDAFEYTGRGRELLIGFLVAMAVLVPIYVAYFLVGIEAERRQAFASFPLLLVIYVLMQYGSFRARRYRATRTIFRGVRLWMTGSGWGYAGRAIVWDLLVTITLGLALPWRMAALERYKMRHTNFGDLQGAFAGTGWTLFKRGWWLWLLTIVAMVSLMIVPIVIVSSGKLDKQTSAQVAGLLPLALVLAAMVLVYPLFRAITLRWWLDGIRFGEVSLASSLRKRSVWWCHIKAALIGTAFTLALGAVFGGLFVVQDVPWQDIFEGAVPPLSLIALFIAFYFILALGLGVIMLQFVTRRVWQLGVVSVTLSGVTALDGVAARGAAAGSLGEGLTDALDFGTGGI